MGHDVPSGPWEKVGIDLFEYKSRDYLLVADYYSNFPLVRMLTSKRADHIISLLKIMFSEHGIPAQVFTDQGTQFTSAEFKHFAQCYQFEVLHSTPRYPQSNGLIEAMVKIVKNTIRKAEESGEDPHLAMLAYRATPRGPNMPSPAEALTQRRFRALLPIKQQRTSKQETSREAMIQQKNKQAEYYNRTARPLPELQQHDLVRVQVDPREPVWRKATITQTPTDKGPRAYQVHTETGRTYTRNRRFIRPTADSPATVPAPPQHAAVPQHATAQTSAEDAHMSPRPATTPQPTSASPAPKVTPTASPVQQRQRPTRDVQAPRRLIQEM